VFKQDLQGEHAYFALLMELRNIGFVRLYLFIISYKNNSTKFLSISIISVEYTMVNNTKKKRF